MTTKAEDLGPLVQSGTEAQKKAHEEVKEYNPTGGTTQAALTYAARGWPVFPAPPGEVKKSYKSAQYSNGRPWGATTDPDEIRRDFAKWPDANVGTVTGEKSGIFVVEADTLKGHAVDGIASLKQLEAKHWQLPSTRTVESPTGSLHYYFKYPKDITVRNSTSQLAPGVDVRGEGGMVLAPPSVRPTVGEYKWLKNFPIPIREAPKWLLDRVAENDKPSKQPQQTLPDELVRLLELDAGKGLSQDPEDLPEPVSPEKVRAALAVIDPDIKRQDWFNIGCVLFNEIGPKGFEFWDLWSSRGTKYNQGEIGQQCRAQWESIVKANGKYDYHIGTLFRHANKANPNWWTKDNQAPVAPVIPVDLWGKFDPPPLPRGLLPEVIEQFAFDQAEMMGCDAGGLGMSALTVCAAVIPDDIQLQMKQHDPYWKESARIWIGLLGNPSTRKSPMIRQAVRSLKRLDAELYRIYIEAKARYDELPPEEKKTEPPPRQQRLCLEDTTIEAAQVVLMDSPDGVLCLQDELSGWFGAMDKYSGPRGAAKDRGFWMQAFNGGSYGINRITRGAGLIPNLSVCILGGIQQEPLCKVMEDSQDDGLIQRLIVIVLRPATLGKDERRSAVVHNYEELVGSLHETLHSKIPTDPDKNDLEDLPLRFDSGAQTIRRQLEQKHLDLQGCEAINKKLAAHIGKYDGLFGRLCVIWHCIENINKPHLPEEVTEDAARRVAKFLHEYLLPHAIVFYTQTLGVSDDHDRLTAMANYILAHKLEKVTNRDVAHGDRTMRKLTRRDIENVFEQLDALGWVTRVPAPRPSDPPHWVVNAEVHKRFRARAEAEAERRAAVREVIQESIGGRR